VIASQFGVYPGAVPPYPPPFGDAASHRDQSHPCHHEDCIHLASEVTPRDVLGQRLLGGALMLVLVGFTGLLWGIDGAFRILFTVYTFWAGFWLYALFVKRPTV